MPEPYCFLWYRICYGTLQPCLGCKRAALLRGILRLGKSHVWHAARAIRGFVHWAVERPLSEVNALYRVPSSFLMSRSAVLAVSGISACPSITRCYWLKTNDYRIMLFSLSASLMPTFILCLSRLFEGFNETGIGRSGDKTQIFDQKIVTPQKI